MSEDLTNALLDRLVYVLMEQGVPDIGDIRTRFAVILQSYQISPTEQALTIYTEGKNEMLLKRFLLAKMVAGCTERTLDHYQKDITRSLQAIGKDADTITSLDVQVLLAKGKQRGLSDHTVDNTRRNLSSFFGWCQREELIQKNPMSKVDHGKLRKKKKHAFSEMEVELIRNACRNNRERAIVEVLLSTGCRVSEIVTIRRDEMEGGSVEVLGKGEKVRRVYLNAKAQLAVMNYLAERSDSNPYLFPRMSDKVRATGRMRSRQSDWYTEPNCVDRDGCSDKGTIENIVRRIGKRAGVDNCHPHRFRRTCATLALRRGMPLEQVSKMLGHAQLSTTQIYLDLTEQELEQSHAKYVL